MTVTSDRAGGARNGHFLINFMKTGRFKSTSFAGLTSRRDLRRLLPLGLINISRENLERFFPFPFPSPIDALPLLKREWDRSPRIAGAPDNRSRRTSRSWRVSALGNLSAPVDCCGCNLSLSRLARMKDSPRLRIFVLQVCEASQISHAPPRNAKTWISLLSAPDVGSTSHPRGKNDGAAARGMKPSAAMSLLFRQLRATHVTAASRRLNTDEGTPETPNEIYD